MEALNYLWQWLQPGVLIPVAVAGIVLYGNQRAILVELRGIRADLQGLERRHVALGERLNKEEHARAEGDQAVWKHMAHGD